MKIHIKNIDAIQVAGKEEVLEGVDIYIEDGEIISIGEELEGFVADKSIDGSDKLALPGLVNAHTHIGMSVLRNYADDLPLWTWLSEKIWPVEATLSDEDIYWASLLSMVEMIETGTTTFNDMYFSVDRVAEALKESGMRGALCRGLTDDGVEKNIEQIEDTLYLYKKWNGKLNDRIRMFVGPHAIYTCHSEFLSEVIGLGEELGTRFHTHLSETKKEIDDAYESHRMTPVEYKEKMGMFKLPTIAAHCVHLTKEDIDIIEKNEVYPVNNPSSNLKLASGFAPVQEMLNRGIPVALGTDGSSSNNNLNMFEEMHIAAILNKALNEDATSVSAYEVIKMATINGAKALGWDEKIGSLEVGKRADIILIDLDKSHLCPRNNLISAVTYSMQGSDVDTVIVDGRILMENREHKVLDVERIKAEVKKIAERI